MADSGKGSTGRARRAVSEATSAARAVTGSRRRGSAASSPASSGAPAKKAPAKKAPAKKAPAKKAPAKKAPAKKAPAKKAPGEEGPGEEGPGEEGPGEEGPGEEGPGEEGPGEEGPGEEGPGQEGPGEEGPGEEGPGQEGPGEEGPGQEGVARKAAPEALVVRADERPWTAAELAEVRALLEVEADRLRSEISEAESDIADLLRDSSDSGGEDQADTGSKTFEREHEMSLAASHREILGQTERALSRIDDGSYGVCESCGNPIGKARLQAFPRATLCMTCKQREERR